ncbi:YD repeat-containing protein [Luteibacter jiangsuensis]|uniref:YD repeat-containing protein n=1 Tax=Luteibacter jiangsuensis TaxID=637577 RepID=A0ABT9T4H0_9GAMM|nr:hypothetical protein [Luteibacter jiangsuensis]MDQ0011172.1 YD repeat-containing protein [Luteibacter jiangsuensis]
MTTDETPAPGLLASGELYSTAFQFYSHINADVDARTGMYSASVDLATGEGNRLRGPHLPFRLSYSAADTIDDGFGTGWRLGLTELDLDASLLTLSSGDSHKVERLLYLEPAHFPDRKLDSCSLVMMDPEHRTAVVEHVTGVIEHLEAMSYPTNLLRPVRIVNPSGDALQLAWEPDSLGISRLTRVVDNDGEALLQIDYADLNNVKLTLHLAAAARREATVPLEMHFNIQAGQLQRIAIPLITELNHSATADGEEAVWAFEYRTVDIMMLLASVTSPDGLRDSVEYDTEALTLPSGGPLSHMPAVATRVRSLVTDATNVVRESRYTYRNGDLDHNFYGYPAVQSWVDRNDQLLHMPGADAYTYGSTEYQYQDGSLLCTIERNYNHFHLITNEKTTRGNVVQDVITRYGIEESTSFEDQKASFQLPHKVTTTCYDLRFADIKQVTITDSSYDDYGNVLSRYDSATDTTETSTYYPPEGEAGLCPPDPLGKVRRLRSRATSPGKNGGPIRSTQYRYVEVPVRDAARNWLQDRTYYIQASGETSTESIAGIETTLAHSEQSFVTDQGNQHGSLRQETREQDGLTETRAFTYETDDVAGTVTTHTTHTTHDGVVNTTSETLHLISGLVHSTVDALGNKAEFTYDPLGRRTSEVLSPDHADYRVEMRWNYQLSMSERWVDRIGITGLPHRVWMDEQGRTIRREEPLPDGALMVVHELEYDGFGQLVREVQIDSMRDGKTLRLETTYAYDDWGRCSRMTSPDGSTTLSETALVQEPPSFGDEVITRTMQWQSYGTDEKTGWRSTYLDAADRQRRAQAGTWSETGAPTVVSTTTWEYDGLGRCVRMEDPLGKATRQAWDGYDRLIRSDLPDGTTVLRDYAPGHEDELVARLAIVPPERDKALRDLAGKAGELELGTRTWDGLGRLKEEQAGSLTTSHAYIPNQMSSDTKTMPSGNTLQMVYDLRLREVLLGSTLLNPDGAVEAVLTQATYDHVLGLPTGIVAEGGSMTITPDYLGRMTDQEIALTGDLPRGCHVTITPGGLVLKKTGTDGITQTYDYDEKGRLKSATDEDVTIELFYDDLSRLDHRTARSADGRSATQRTAYDPLGRVNEQTWEHTEGSTTQTRRLAFVWRADDKVSERRWYDDDTLLRTETMDYDDRGRLILHGIDAVAGEHPLDETGQPYVKQEFEHDCLDNLRTVTTALLDGRVNVTRYGYDTVDFDRLASVSNSLDGYPGYGTPLELVYDANGNLVDDGQGRTLQWDGAGRLANVTLADNRRITYVHGPDGRVSSVTIDDVPRYRYREDGAIAFEVDALEGRRFIRAEGGIVAETRLAGAIRETFLLGTDPQGSVVTESVPDGMA